jgi:hypothetical protein
MEAQLRTLLTVDGELLETIATPDPAFSIVLRAMVGPTNAEGEESFDFNVCSPAWLEAELERLPIIGGRFLLVTREFDAKRIDGYVRNRIAQASGDDWPSVAAKIARWAQWEFQDYPA